MSDHKLIKAAKAADAEWAKVADECSHLEELYYIARDRYHEGKRKKLKARTEAIKANVKAYP
jgi:hypothetical protein